MASLAEMQNQIDSIIEDYNDPHHDSLAETVWLYADDIKQYPEGAITELVGRLIYGNKLTEQEVRENPEFAIRVNAFKILIDMMINSGIVYGNLTTNSRENIQRQKTLDNMIDDTISAQEKLVVYPYHEVLSPRKSQAH